MQQEFEFEFEFVVVVSYSRKDEAVLLELAGRLRNDGGRVWLDQMQIHVVYSIPGEIEYGLQHSRLLLLCVSVHALGADWVRLESQTFRFRAPLNTANAPLQYTLHPVLPPQLLPNRFLAWGWSCFG